MNKGIERGGEGENKLALTILIEYA